MPCSREQSSGATSPNAPQPGVVHVIVRVIGEAAIVHANLAGYYSINLFETRSADVRVRTSPSYDQSPQGKPYIIFP